MKLIAQYRSSALLLMVCLAFAASPAQAGFQQVGSIPGLQANDTIFWSTFGGDITALSPPVSLTTTMGAPGTLAGSSAFTILAGSTYGADFLPTDFVVSAFDSTTFTSLSTGIQINLPLLVMAIGAQVQVNAFGPFSATMQAFDASSTLVGSVTVNSSVGDIGDGSAVFLGGVTTSNPIASITVTANNVGIALDTVYLQDAAPEPSAFYLAVPGLAAFVLRRKLSRR